MFVQPLLVTAMLATASSVRVQPFLAERYYAATTPNTGYADRGYAMFRNASNPLSESANRVRVSYEVDGVLVEPCTFQSDAVEASYIDRPLTAPDKLNIVKTELGLSITQLAELFGVTRKTIYDWYDGVEPRTAAINRIEILLHLLSDRPNDVDIQRLKTVWKIPVSGASFLSILHSDTLADDQRTNSLSQKLEELGEKLAMRADRGKPTAYRLGKNNLSVFERHAEIG